ncbi:hypothetical protein CP8484711_2020A, partial [Chlamydia psittaci 84-8471/1]
MVQKY